MDTVIDEAYQRFMCERHDQIMQIVDEAAARSGRSAADVRAIAVSKTVGTTEVLAARAAGWSYFGENRPQELARKRGELDGVAAMEGAHWHMIGNLQTNKINQVLGRAELIHSISSAHLAQAVSTRAEARGLEVPVLLEVNVSGEASKSGFSPNEVRAGLDALMALSGVRVEGLMTMAPAHDASAARATFSGLRELADELRARSGLALATLSCGMSDDFDIAVEEGSTLVRLGRCTFSQDYVLA